MLTSDLLNAQVPSRTFNAGGISTGTLSYTASAGPVEVYVNYPNNADRVTANGIQINSNITNNPMGLFKMFLGIGQTITVVSAQSAPLGVILSVRTSP